MELQPPIFYPDQPDDPMEPVGIEDDEPDLGRAENFADDFRFWRYKMFVRNPVPGTILTTFDPLPTERPSQPPRPIPIPPFPPGVSISHFAIFSSVGS